MPTPHYTVRLSDTERAILLELGKGNLSHGIRKAAQIVKGLRTLADEGSVMGITAALRAVEYLIDM